MHSEKEKGQTRISLAVFWIPQSIQIDRSIQNLMTSNKLLGFSAKCVRSTSMNNVDH